MTRVVYITTAGPIFAEESGTVGFEIPGALERYEVSEVTWNLVHDKAATGEADNDTIRKVVKKALKVE